MSISDSDIPVPDETDGQRIAREWADSGDEGHLVNRLNDLARRINEGRAALACAIHRACTREPGDCCTIGSVIGHWDRQYAAEAQRAEEAKADYRMVRAALLATRDHDEPDGPCWCRDRLTRPWPLLLDHLDVCLQARAASGMTEPEP